MRGAWVAVLAGVVACGCSESDHPADVPGAIYYPDATVGTPAADALAEDPAAPDATDAADAADASEDVSATQEAGDDAAAADATESDSSGDEPEPNDEPDAAEEPDSESILDAAHEAEACVPIREVTQSLTVTTDGGPALLKLIVYCDPDETTPLDDWIGDCVTSGDIAGGLCTCYHAGTNGTVCSAFTYSTGTITVTISCEDPGCKP